ncbi:MAG TPA: long-chain-acyl-CoA synthetase [Smithella sp.]|nr:long-chain-acyl-CoA synthetase [Smithella sp.]MDM7986153.1 long-chain-acyl-CoA synthetase [Smithella sp.]HNY50930.1 long-chain-acyl-CoA synthetase [Smithella sp.]HOG90986.1 long-chain-acyl-CoA synthetase [Smithella sp.]HOU52009.1 long-chain-acyl-CoA synthetase [Smithella sp.]
MKKSDTGQYPQTISGKDFFMKLLTFIGRLPYVIYHGIRGIRSISTNRNLCWGSYLENIAQKYPDNVAVKSPDGTLTYRELNEKANQFAHFLLSRKVVKGDTVTLCLENRPELLVLYCGCAKIGAVCSLINTNQRGDSLVYSFNLNKGKVVIVGEECYDFFKEVKSGVDLQSSYLCFLRDPAINRLKDPEDVTDLIATMPKTNLPQTQTITLKDPIAYVYTSGTTGGMPKAAVITNKRAVSATFWFGRVVTRVTPRHTIYIPLPFFHTNAITVGWPPAMSSGAAVALRRKFSASGFLEDVKKFQATHFVYVGEVCRYLMAQPVREGENKTSLKYIIGNGLRPDIWMAFKKRFGIRKIFEFYGAAEGVGVFTNLMNFDYTVGTSLTPFAIVKYDIENDCPERNHDGFLTKVAKGESGLLIMEISEKTPFPGYTDKKKTEEKIIRDAFRKGDLWFNTGDMLRNMGFRHAQFVDRLGDTFRWKGENVATMEVEKALDSFPGISSSAVYGVMMPKGDGRAGMAAVIREEGKDIDFAALTAHLRSVLPKYAVPIFIRFVNNFQLTATHKIKKTDLKNDGYNPAVIKRDIFVLLPGNDSYVPLNDTLYQDIVEGKYKF